MNKVIDYFHKTFYPDMKFEDVANAINSNEEVANNAMAYMYENHYPDLSPEEFMSNVKPTGREPILVTNPNDPRLKAFNDSNYVYNKYKDKEEWQGGREVLKFNNPSEEKQYKDLLDKTQQMDNAQFAEEDALWGNPEFKRLPESEQLKRLKIISDKYSNSANYKNMVARLNYLNTANTVVEKAKYTPKWFENKNLTERGLKPVSWDEKEQEINYGSYNTTRNQYGTVIDRNNPTSENSRSEKTVRFSPNFQEPVQPVKLVKKKNQSKVQEVVKAKEKAQEATKVQKEAPKQEPKTKGKFYQGRQFIEETGLRPNYYTPEEVSQAKARQDSVYRARVKKGS